MTTTSTTPTENPKPVDRPSIHYLYDDATKIIYWSEKMPENRHDLIYIGESNHPNPRGGAAHLMRTNKINTGFKVRKLL